MNHFAKARAGPNWSEEAIDRQMKARDIVESWRERVRNSPTQAGHSTSSVE